MSFIPDQELIQDLKSVAEKLGHSPSESEYDRVGKYSRSTVKKRFGSWNKAKARADLPTERQPSQLND